MNKFKFALVTADTANSVKFKFNGERDDCTSFMSWVEIWDGVHYSFDKMKEDCSVLFEYDCVMLDGHPYYMETLLELSKKLKGKVVTMFLPEGDVSLYDKEGINSFSPLIYDAMNSVDILVSMEEDKLPYYSFITKSLAKFIHVPLDSKMSSGSFRVSNARKSASILIYGDNNPNCPVTAFAVASKLGRKVRTVCIKPEQVDGLKRVFNVEIEGVASKLGQYPFLRLLGTSWLHIYPTRWIGSSREPIACAVARTPCIGSDRSHTQRRLFPKLACDIYDVNKMYDLGKRLYEDMEFYDEVVNYAWDNVQFYNLENTKKRFIEAYEEARKLC